MGQRTIKFKYFVQCSNTYPCQIYNTLELRGFNIRPVIIAKSNSVSTMKNANGRFTGMSIGV